MKTPGDQAFALRSFADDRIRDRRALGGRTGYLGEMPRRGTVGAAEESHSDDVPGRLDAKRKGEAIDGHSETGGVAGGGEDERPGEGRRVPPPEVPGCTSPGGVPDAGAEASAPQTPAAGSQPWPPSPPGPNPWPAAPPVLGGMSPAETTPVGSRADARGEAPPGHGGAGVVPATFAASPGEPFYLPDATWLWPRTVAGLALGSAPEALLYLVALLAGTASGTGGKVTAGSAAALAVGSLILYGWQTTAAWLFSLRTAGRKLALWGFRRPTKAIFWTVPLGLVAVYVVSIAHDIVVRPEQQQIISEFPRSGMGIGLFVLVAVIMAPLFEEIVFRGFLFRGFANSWGWVWGALASSAIFGLAHLQLDVFLPLAALGFALAWAYRQTGSLWTCITMHGLFNLIAVVAWAVTG